MAGTKIFVLKMKDVVKYGAIAVVGLLILILLLTLVLSRRGGGDALMEDPNTAIFIPGEYTAFFVLNDRPLEVTVTVTEHEIESITMSEMAESTRLLFPLFEPMMAQLVETVLHYQNARVELPTTFPVTAGILQNAVIAAVDQAMVTE